MKPEAIANAANGLKNNGREIFDALPIAIFITDANGLLTYFNPAAAKLAGRTPELGVDRWCITWKIFLPDGTPLPHNQCPLAAVLNGHDVAEGADFLAERPDHSRFWAAHYPAVLRDADGRITGGINTLVETTAQKASQMEAERASLLLSAIVDSSDDAIISKDLNGIITSWNKSAERLFGYTAEEIVGQPVTVLMPPERLDEEPNILARLRRGERVDHFETVRRRKDGSLLDISLTISPVRDARGNVIGASKIARDITERRRADAELQRANADLQQFAYSASHDLQEPLRGVKIYSELLASRYGDKLEGQALEYLIYLRAGATRMETMLQDLLAFNQVGRIEEPETTDANVVLGNVLDNLANTIAASHAEITADPLPLVPMHHAHLQQLLQNLVGNAIKYRSPERTPAVHIAGSRQDSGLLFSVSDNGIGIAEKYTENVFGLFKRLHSAREYAGTGIGLAICKRIVEQYRGRIWVESELDKGSTFHFTIPEPGALGA